MRPTVKAFLTPLASILILFNIIIARPTSALDDATVLQQQAIQRIDRVLEHRRKTGDNQGTVAELQLAEGELLNSYRSFLSSGNVASAALSATKIGFVQRLLGKSAEARTSFQLAYDLALRANHTGHQVNALLGLAKAELYRSGSRDYQAVARYVDEAIPLATRTGDKEGLCDALQVKAELQTELREFRAAADSINRAFPLAVELKDQMFLFYAYNNRAIIYSELAGNCDYDRGVASCYDALNHAKEDYLQAQSVVRKLQYNFLATVIDRSLKNIELKRQLVKLKEVDSRLSSSTRIFNPQKAGDVLVSQSFLPPKSSEAMAGIPGGTELFGNLKPLLEEQIKRAADSATGNFLRGSLKDINDQPDAALEYYLQAVKLLDSDSRNLRDEKSLGTFLEDKIQIYYSPMLHFLERQRYAEAFDLMENSRTRAMADLLRNQVVKVRPEDQKLYADYLNFTARTSLLQQKVFRARTQADSVENRQNIEVTEKEIQGLEVEYQNVLKRMGATGSKLLGLVAPQTATLQMLQRSMKAERYEVLYYVVLDKQVIIWHLSGDETHVVSVFLPRLELIKKVNSLRESLKNPARDSEAKFDEQTAREMFLFLIQPVLKWIQTDHLVVIPHEDLNYVPFQIFYDGERNKYLGELFQLSYAPSATILSRLKKVKSISGGNLLAVDSSSLVEGENEVKALGQLYSARSKIVVDPRLKESDVKTWIGDYDLIHLSVHGKFNQAEPLLSYLVLNQGGADDGMLSTAEMFGLPLTNAQLVVLSACETGQAKATRANEIIGMERALLYAGANSLVLSSWRVDAASTELWMTTFYREAQSKPLSEASRLASMMVKNKYSHPYYWSPFLLIGK